MLVALATIKAPGHSRHNSMETKGNHLTDISAKNDAVKENHSQISVMAQSDVVLNGNLEKSTRDNLTVGSREGKTVLEIIVGSIKREDSGLDQIIIWPYQKF